MLISSKRPLSKYLAPYIHTEATIPDPELNPSKRHICNDLALYIHAGASIESSQHVEEL